MSGCRKSRKINKNKGRTSKRQKRRNFLSSRKKKHGGINFPTNFLSCQTHKMYYHDEKDFVQDCTLKQAKDLNCNWSKNLEIKNPNSCEIVERGQGALRESSESKARKLNNNQKLSNKSHYTNNYY